MSLTKRIDEMKEMILTNIEEREEVYLNTSHSIHENPEIGNQEFYASGLLTELLANEGFEVTKNVAGHETAFIARKHSGHKGPAVAFLAEYDALPGLGHACGHNIIGTTSVAAAIALSQALDQIGGEVVVLGTPAEEGGPNGSAKGSFVKHGLLKGLDAALMVHPFHKTKVTGYTLAVDPLDFEYIGKSAHAAFAPEEGINALDAVIQLFNGINALRQHVSSDVRIHGIITHGGEAPNIVPDYAKARFFIRAAKRKTCAEVTERVKKIAEGAALATGAKLNIIEFQNEVDDFILNEPFDQLFANACEAVGEPIDRDDLSGIGSTDAGNISQVIPTIHPYIKIGSDSLVPHTPEFREAARSEVGDRALVIGAKALALTALPLYTDEGILQEIKQVFKKRIEKEK